MASPGGCLGLLAWLLLLQPRLGDVRAATEPPAPPAPPAPLASPPPTAGWPPAPSRATGPTAASVFGPGDSDSYRTLAQAPPATQSKKRLEFGSAAPACGQRSMRVVGGQPAEPKKWPWQVSLQVKEEHVCGGSLISNQLVLTAAHCIHGHMEYAVMLGDTNLKHEAETAVVVPVKDIVVYQYFSNFGVVENDIALVMLAFPVNYSTHIQPVCLPEKAFMVETNTLCWVTGWGKLKEKDPEKAAPSDLQEAELRIVRYKNCNSLLQKKMNTREDLVKKGAICGYSAEGKDSCQGDSGGPLVCEFNNTWTQVGIVSWGIGCGRPGYPGVYTEVSFYKDWLMNRVNLASFLNSANFLILSLCVGILVAL